MELKAVLFDLDGTLLPMDQEKFVNDYLTRLAIKLAPYGYDSKALAKGIWAGTGAMVKNDGTKTNEEAFWETFAALLGPDVRKDEPIFDAFYRNEFQHVKESCGFAPQAAEAVAHIKASGLRVTLATNPIFPAIATESRIRWAGLSPDDFEICTTYENSRHCKPNPEYYRDVLRQMDLRPEECLMVGNDVTEDMIAQTLGMGVFLLTDCMINKEGKNISQYPHGSFDELMAFVDEIVTK